MLKIDQQFYKHHIFTSIDDVASIMQPLQEYCGIDCFTYELDHLDLSSMTINRSAITNNKQFLLGSYIVGQQVIKPEYHFYKEFLEKYYLMDITCPKWTSAIAAECGIYNFITKTTQIDAYTKQTIIFATTSSDPQYKNFYLQNQDLLDKFTHYFLDKAKKILAASYKNSFCLKDVKIHIHEDYPGNSNIPKITELKQLIEPKHYTLRFNSASAIGLRKSVKIPAAEMHCLELLARGRSAKEIGSILNISPKTVEVNWSKSKIRLGCHTRRELLNIIEKSIT